MDLNPEKSDLLTFATGSIDIAILSCLSVVKGSCKENTFEGPNQSKSKH